MIQHSYNKRNNFQASRPAFTLIEMMVAVTVIGILTTVSVARFRQFNTRQEVITASKEVMSLMREAQKRAKSGNRPSECDSPTYKTLTGYKLEVYNVPLSGVRISAVCGGEDVTQKEVTFSSNTYFGGEGEYIFDGLSGGVNLAGGVDGAGVITLTNGTLSYEIEVTGAGAINELGEVL